MTVLFEYVERDAYLVATISDRTINPQRAIAILKLIDSECRKCKCRKVLLNESTVEKRDIANHEIHSISKNMPDIHLACLCKPELIDEKSELFNAFTFTDGYIARHFSVEGDALAWLLSKH